MSCHIKIAVNKQTKKKRVLYFYYPYILVIFYTALLDFAKASMFFPTALWGKGKKKKFKKGKIKRQIQAPTSHFQGTIIQLLFRIQYYKSLSFSVKKKKGTSCSQTWPKIRKLIISSLFLLHMVNHKITIAAFELGKMLFQQGEARTSRFCL